MSALEATVRPTNATPPGPVTLPVISTILGSWRLATTSAVVTMTPLAAPGSSVKPAVL